MAHIYTYIYICIISLFDKLFSVRAGNTSKALTVEARKNTNITVSDSLSDHGMGYLTKTSNDMGNHGGPSFPESLHVSSRINLVPLHFPSSFGP